MLYTKMEKKIRKPTVLQDLNMAKHSKQSGIANLFETYKSYKKSCQIQVKGNVNETKRQYL